MVLARTGSLENAERTIAQGDYQTESLKTAKRAPEAVEESTMRED